MAHQILEIKLVKRSPQDRYSLVINGRLKKGYFTHEDLMWKIGEAILEMARKSGEDI